MPELSLGQTVREVRRAVNGKCKVEHIYRVDSEPISPALIEKAVEAM